MNRILNILWFLGYHIIHSIKSLFSFSLSTAEQSIFEEEFKYLIVTSPLFNGTPQFDEQYSPLMKQKNKSENDINTYFINKTNLLYINTFIVIISIFLVIQMNFVIPLIPCFIFAYFTISYFIYRHDRHTQIRSIHTSALDSMHKIILLSQETDNVLYQLIHTFQSTLNNSLIYQQQQHLGNSLSSHFETYLEIVHQLQPLIDSHNLSRLRDMYNVKDEIPSTLLEFDSLEFKLENIELVYSFVIWKRREYLLHLLALDVMSNNKSAHYGRNWRQAIRVNLDLYKEYQEFNKKLTCIKLGLDSIPREIKENQDETEPLSPTTSEGFMMTDKRTESMIQKLNSVEKLMEEIQANLFLCHQDTTPISSNRVSNLNLEKISKRFRLIDKNMNNMKHQWEESKQSLNILLEDEELRLKHVSINPNLPSPPTSPKEESILQKTQSFRFGTVQTRQSYTDSRLRRIQSLKIDKSNRRLAKTKSI